MFTKSLLSLIFIFSYSFLNAAQIDDYPFDPDSTIRFTSPRPLIDLDELNSVFKRSWGIELNISGHGFGAGAYLERRIAPSFSIFGNFIIANAKGSDEFEQFIPGQPLQVINKINRIYMMPMMFGGKADLFRETISPSFKPFIATGLGPTFILSTPYRENRQVDTQVVGFFSSFAEPEFYTRFGGYLEIGSGLSFSANNFINVHARYYYIPFGGDGLESIKDVAITDFGGLFLGLSVMFLY